MKTTRLTDGKGIVKYLRDPSKSAVEGHTKRGHFCHANKESKKRKKKLNGSNTRKTYTQEEYDAEASMNLL